MLSKHIVLADQFFVELGWGPKRLRNEESEEGWKEGREGEKKNDRRLMDMVQ